MDESILKYILETFGLPAALTALVAWGFVSRIRHEPSEMTPDSLSRRLASMEADIEEVQNSQREIALLRREVDRADLSDIRTKLGILWDWYNRGSPVQRQARKERGERGE